MHIKIVECGSVFQITVLCLNCIKKDILKTEDQNEVLMHELEQKKKDLRAYKCMYRSSYEGFESMRKKEIK